MPSLLLLSHSTHHGERYLAHAADEIVDLLASCRRVLFVPFALHDRAAYTAKFRIRLEELGRSVDELAADATGRRQIETAEAVFVGGGNTFRLLKTLQEAELLAPLRERVLAGMAELGRGIETRNQRLDQPLAVAPEARSNVGQRIFRMILYAPGGAAIHLHLGCLHG